ncbi:MAG: alpha/beta hydrolase [Bacteroidota bacterium]
MEKFYNKRIFQFITVIGFIILLAYSCKKDEPQLSQSYQELFWVINKGSQMPVLMTGNKESSSILLFIHGGPGGSSIEIAGLYAGNSPANLTDNFLLASWDQRYAGYSINPDPVDWSTVNVDQYAEDCANVIDQLKIRFPGKKIIVIGHSWGGAALTKFISNPAYQDKYNGWVVVDGMVNGFELACAMQSYSRQRCNELIAEGNVQYLDTLAYLNSVVLDPAVYDKPTFLRLQMLALSLMKPGEKPLDPVVLSRCAQLEKNIFPDSADQIRKINNAGSQVPLEIFYNQVYFINSNAYYVNISKPGLIIWGENDCAVPADAAYPFTGRLDSLGKTFQFKLYPDCWHTPMFSNREQYINDIKNFIVGL